MASPRPQNSSSSDSPPPPSSSPPPPPPSSSSPPPSSGTPPSDENSPPPPASGSSPPSDDDSPPPPPPPKGGNNGDNHSPPPPPPPPPPPQKSQYSPPPPRSLSPPSGDSSGNDSAKKDNWMNDHVIPIVVGVAIGISALLLLALVVYLCTSRKKKKRAPEHDDYGDKSHRLPRASVDYYNSPSRHNWGSKGNGESPSPPGPGLKAWAKPPPPPPPIVSSGEVSSNFSGPRGPALPPPHPSVALGFTKNTFTYDELAAATGGFSQGNLLGQGGFGYVHKGVLPNGKEIAVKSLKAGSGQGDREFQAEIEIISRVHHRHLVSLVGYCIAGGQRLLVYEFVPNCTLEFHLHGKGRPTMDWPTRLKIAVGSAKGLAYLHEDCHPRIIHRDIKASNILLDNSFEAKVADFGLAKLSSDTNTHVSTRVMGTFGYLAPEYASSGKLTEKSDVFSFGIMLLELITGRLPVDITGDMDDSLVDWARPLCASALEDGNYDELVDPRLEGNYVPHELARMVACAAASIRHSARRRPKMSQIVRALEGDASLDQLNDGVRPGQSSIFSLGGSGSTDFDNGTYSADMRKFRKAGLDSQEYASSEYGQTSEHGIDLSSSSGEEIGKNGIERRRQSPLVE